MNDILKNGEFIINDYDTKKPFASFLPGIAGIHGIPLWCHYTNRAQCITSFGLRDKNGCILEFYPANSAYRFVDKMGFRTFLKINNQVFEPFSVSNKKNKVRTMYVSQASFRIEEIDNQNKIKTEVTYFILPNENIAGLVRQVKITNLSDKLIDLSVLDGITQLLPTDANEWMLKHQSNLLKSWMDVRLIDDKVGFYFENSIPSDTAEVNVSTHGNYYASFVNHELVKTIYDLNVLFDYDTSLTYPINFEKHSVEELLAMEQVSADKVSGGFSLAHINLEKNQTLKIDTVIGYSETDAFIQNKIKDFMDPKYFDKQSVVAKDIIFDITKDIETSSNQPLFDEYMKQNYLDNILRGGIPYFIDTKSKHFTYHLFSRRHGDMEREYNFFTIAPEFYSQGNGNFRDVCQNRRSDTLFHPEVRDFNVKMFAELIGLDGYNPLGVLGLKFHLEDDTNIDELVDSIFVNKKDIIINALKQEFTPGSIVNLIYRENIGLKVSEDEMLKLVFEHALSDTTADFGEGYWVDHWTYILDLVENLENIYPELMNKYLYDDLSYRFYNCPVTVLPRKEKYVLNKFGKVRQYGALLEKDYEKIGKCKMNEWGTNWLKYQDSDEVVKINLFSKLFHLAISKFTLLDPFGIGISMEANKPGWNDAMNGLPGLFASGVSETIELARLIKYLINHIDHKDIILPEEVVTLINETKALYKQDLSEFALWDKVTTLVEIFRENTRFGVSGITKVDYEDVLDFLKLMNKVVDKGLAKALAIGDGIYPTFLTYNAVKYEKQDYIGHYGLPTVKVLEFELKPLPYFLEAPARSMKYISDKDLLKKQYQLIKQTELYDKVLKMYKTSVPLDDESMEIGRIRAFQKGWLERESNFLHMTYKYLLGLLKCGLYNEYFEEIKTNYTCFMDPNVYGRSVFENSSFIATSNNPDRFLHGTGFIARLSGSTAEALSMWNIMMFGHHPFILENQTLKLNLRPILTKDFFKDDNTLEVSFLSKVKVIYHLLGDSLNIKNVKYQIEGKPYEEVTGEIAEKIRDGKIPQIDVYLS